MNREVKFLFWGGGGHRVDVNKVFVKIKKKKIGWVGLGGGGGQGGCERRIEVFCENSKKKIWGGGGRGRGRGRVWGFRVDVNEELKFL